MGFAVSHEPRFTERTVTLESTAASRRQASERPLLRQSGDGGPSAKSVLSAMGSSRKSAGTARFLTMPSAGFVRSQRSDACSLA